MAIKGKFLLLGVIFVFVLFGLAGSADAAYPVIRVSCDGCSNQIEAANGYTFYGDVGARIVLTVSETGGSGDVTYVWTNSGGGVCGNPASCPKVRFVVESGSTVYTLTATDRDYGPIVKTVTVSPKISQTGNCLPVWQGDGITVDDGGRNRKALAEGDFVLLEADFDDSDCSNYQFHWEADNPDIIIVDSGLPKTEIQIRSGARAGYTAVVRAILSNSIGQRSEKNFTTNIVSNTPPTAIANIVGAPRSYTEFNVGCGGSQTGNGYNESSDFIWKCSAILKDSAGQAISQDSQTARNGAVPLLGLTPGKSGFYTVVLTVEDSHGKTSTTSVDIWVEEGTTGEDVPPVFVKGQGVENAIYCYVGAKCRIDASETILRNNRSVTLKFYILSDGNKVEMVSSETGEACSGSVCTFVFNRSEIYQVEVEARYFRETDKFGFKVVPVVVLQNISALQTPSTATPQATPAVQAPTVQQQAPMRPIEQSAPTASQYAPSGTISGGTPPKTPGIGAAAVLGMVFLVRIFARKKI